MSLQLVDHVGRAGSQIAHFVFRVALRADDVGHGRGLAGSVVPHLGAERYERFHQGAAEQQKHSRQANREHGERHHHRAGNLRSHCSFQLVGAHRHLVNPGLAVHGKRHVHSVRFAVRRKGGIRAGLAGFDRFPQGGVVSFEALLLVAEEVSIHPALLIAGNPLRNVEDGLVLLVRNNYRKPRHAERSAQPVEHRVQGIEREGYAFSLVLRQHAVETILILLGRLLLRPLEPVDFGIVSAYQPLRFREALIVRRRGVQLVSVVFPRLQCIRRKRLRSGVRGVTAHLPQAVGFGLQEGIARADVRECAVEHHGHYGERQEHERQLANEPSRMPIVSAGRPLHPPFVVFHAAPPHRVFIAYSFDHRPVRRSLARRAERTTISSERRTSSASEGKQSERLSPHSERLTLASCMIVRSPGSVFRSALLAFAKAVSILKEFETSGTKPSAPWTRERRIGYG